MILYYYAKTKSRQSKLMTPGMELRTEILSVRRSNVSNARNKELFSRGNNDEGPLAAPTASSSIGRASSLFKRHNVTSSFSACLKQQDPSQNHAYGEHLEYVTVFDDEDEYDAARSTWNHAKLHLQFPNIIAFPASAEEVSLVVKCTRLSGQYICARNGKHSFESDTCTYGVVVDVSKMKQITTLDGRLEGKESPVVRLGAGLTLGQVAVEVVKLGLVVPMGSCATVGLTGLTLVGGQGPLSRLYGMLSDYVSAIELIDERAQIVLATVSNEYADYLWLARGGGSGTHHFPGIITAIELSGLPSSESSSSDTKSYIDFRIEYNPTVENAVQMLSDWQKLHMDPKYINDPLFNRITMEPWIFVDAAKKGYGWKKKVFLTVYFYGTAKHRSDFRSRYMPMLKIIFTGTTKAKITNWQYHTSIGFQRYLAGVKSNKKLASGKHGWNINDRWKGYSAVVSKAVSNKAFRILAEGILESQPMSKRYVELKPLGGEIKKMDKSETAFSHRDALWWSLTNHFFPDDINMTSTHADSIRTESRRHHQSFVDAMGGSFSGYYAGYIDRGSSNTLHPSRRELELYYGGNARRIKSIKTKRDPQNLFRVYIPEALSHSVKQGSVALSGAVQAEY